MPTARNTQVNLQHTAYYHCVSRCVRRAYLCGKDNYTGQSYEHRRKWVEDRIHLLSSVFAIDICAYAVMSNHTHLVLKINRDKALSWTNNEVFEQWHKLYKGTELSRRAAKDMPLTDIETTTLRETIKIWRLRLHDISWFMGALNEYIARQANKEDDCTGRFWEGRFKSQAILGESALAACMAYVDLNPIRANMANTPEQSEHTSIQYRINAHKAGKTPKFLMAFQADNEQHASNHLPFALHDYLQLVDITGRQLSKNKRGKVDDKLPNILTRLNIPYSHFTELVTSLEYAFSRVIGTEAQLLSFQVNQGLERMRHKENARRLLG